MVGEENMMKTIFPFLIIVGISFAGPWPGTNGQDISDNVPGNYEPSDCVWHTVESKLYLVCDEGRVFSITESGANYTTENFGSSYDLEGICIADPNTDYLYLGREAPDEILEYQISTKTITRTFEIGEWTNPGSDGIEALTFVTDSTSLEGGYFYAGKQTTGQIFVFELPIASSDTAQSVTYVKTLNTNRTDLSGMHFEPTNQVLYAIWDSHNIMSAYDKNANLLHQWQTMPLYDQEGVAVGNGKLFFGLDAGPIHSYDFVYALDTTVIGNGSVVIASGAAYYGTPVTLTAVPEGGHTFTGWSGDTSTTVNPITIIMTDDKTVQATFEEAAAIQLNRTKANLKPADFSIGNTQKNLLAFYVETGKSEMGQISVYDVRGRVVWFSKITDGQNVICWNKKDMNSNHASAGLYFAALSVRSRKVTKRFVLFP